MTKEQVFELRDLYMALDRAKSESDFARTRLREAESEFNLAKDRIVSSDASVIEATKRLHLFRVKVGDK